MVRHLLAAAGLAVATWTTAGAASPTPAAAPTPDPMADIRVERDVVFARVDGETLALDVYRRADSGDVLQPVLLFLHGGGWISGLRIDAVPEDDPRMRRPGKSWSKSWPSMLPYVRRGMSLVTASYRLGPKAPEPAAVEDAFRALAWVGREGHEHGLDREKVVLAGVSAGGHLALLTAFTEKSGLFFPVEKLEPGPDIRGVIDFYGVADVADLLSGENERPFAAQWVASRSLNRARYLSPITYVRKGLPPVLIVHGDKDAVVPYDQSRRLANALEAAGNEVDLVPIRGANHGWFSTGELREIENAVLRFLDRPDVLGSIDRATEAGAHEAPKPASGEGLPSDALP